MPITINPTIFFSLSSSGKEVLDFIQENEVHLKSGINSRFIRWISIDDQYKLTSSFESESISFPIKSNDHKSENYSIVSHQRGDYVAVFQRLISDIYNIENKNFASENGIQLSEVQIVVLASADDPLLSPFLMPLLQSLGSLPQSPSVHNVLLYNNKLDTNNSKEASCYKNAFFKELERFRLKQTQHGLFVWLVDIINEEEISVGHKLNTYNAIAKFVDILIQDGDTIESSSITYGLEFEKPCMYSTFGYALLTFPSSKLKEYISIHACDKELHALTNEFTEKFERITFKEELSGFIRESGLSEIPSKLGKKDDTESIYGGFVFDYKPFILTEKDAVLYKKLGVVDNPETLSSINSKHFFYEVGEYEKNFKQTTLSEIASDRQAAKNRELKNAQSAIVEKLKDLIDNKGVCYTRIFTSLLANSEGAVISSLEGRHVEFETLSSLEDSFRGLFIGDIIKASIVKLQEESDNYANKNRLIKDHTKKIEDIKKGQERLAASVGEDNPQFVQLSAECDVLEQEIIRLKGDVEKHDIEIKSLKHEIEQVKNDFERDAFKEDIKALRNEKHFEELESISDRLAPVDQKLAELYGQKNKTIESSKKFIVKNLVIIPVLLIAILIIVNVLFFFKTDFYNGEEFAYGMLASAILEICYLGFSLFGLYKLNKTLQGILNEVKALHSTKSQVLASFITLKDQIYRNDFNFDKDLIALDIASKLLSYAKEKQVTLEDFVGAIETEASNFKERKSNFKFQDSSFEFCVVAKPDIESLYNSAARSNILRSVDGFKLSESFEKFESTSEITELLKPVREEANSVNERKIDSVTLKSVLFNENDDFPNPVKKEAKFEQLIGTSRPLLRTVNWPGITSKDVPYTENILVGKKQVGYDDYLSKIKFGDTAIHRDDESVLGILSVKSNFPSFMIYDVEENEELLRGIESSEVLEYFIDEKNASYSLIPTLNVSGGSTNDANGLGGDLIVALTTQMIVYDADKSKFENNKVGSLGFSFEELIGNWNSPICFDIIVDAKEKDEEILNYDDSEFAAYRKSFETFLIELPIKIPAKFLSEIEEYYYSIQGNEEGWSTVKKSLKAKR